MENKIFEIINFDQVADSASASGPCQSKIYEKHCTSYGENGANSILEKVHSIFDEVLKQQDDPHKSNNALLVGKVQSGKTSNLEMLTALACDRNYDLIIIYGGYDTKLLDQTEKRFREAFDIPTEPSDYYDRTPFNPVLFTTAQDSDFNISNLDPSICQEFIERKNPIIITALKSPKALNKVNELIKNFSGLIKAIIIDDEGDQASLDTTKNKGPKRSSTYREICLMKKRLDDPLYFSVTATPQANIFLNDISELVPSSIHLLHPGKGYCGAEAFHLSENNNIFELPSSDVNAKVIHLALIHFLMASVVAQKLSLTNGADMIVHVAGEVTIHKNIFEEINNQLRRISAELQTTIDYKIVKQRIVLENQWEEFFEDSIKDKISFDDGFMESMKKIIHQTTVILQNGEGKHTQQNANFKRYRIWVGGDLLQRGLTFKYLLTTLFTRWAKNGGNMDTNLQRARWFGYREQYFSLCKIFTTNEIRGEFAALADIEEDLWAQFAAVESDKLPINDIYVKAENTRQKPTRRNVVDTQFLEISDWKKQNIITYDQNQIRNNNLVTERFLSSLNFTGTTLGSADNDTKRNLIAYTNVDEVKEYFDSLEGIFHESSFNKVTNRYILNSLNPNSKIAIILMSNGNVRERSFMNSPNTNKIIVLQQGRDPNSRTYLGDKHVVDYAAPLTVQLYNIIPKHNGCVEPKFQQYMHALFSNRSIEKRFVRR